MVDKRTESLIELFRRYSSKQLSVDEFLKFREQAVKEEIEGIMEDSSTEEISFFIPEEIQKEPPRHSAVIDKPVTPKVQERPPKMVETKQPIKETENPSNVEVFEIPLEESPTINKKNNNALLAMLKAEVG